MSSLDDAWEWYQATQRQLHRLGRLADLYWENFSWDGPLGRDDEFRLLSSAAVSEESRLGLARLDDLAVVILFSSFEALVRERILREVEVEAATLRHAALIDAARDAKEQIDRGSFFRVLKPYKDLDANLVEEINQVRQYRNWIAHGRKGKEPASVTPKTAYDRLRRFLDRLVPAAGTDD